MIDFLTGNVFQCMVLPLLTTSLTIFARIISRPDKVRALDRNVFNVGINLCVTATFILVTKCIILSKAIVGSDIELRRGIDILIKFGAECFAMVLGLIAVAYLVHKFGWERSPVEHLRISMGWGIIMPNIVGILYLVFVFTQTVEGL